MSAIFDGFQKESRTPRRLSLLTFSLEMLRPSKISEFKTQNSVVTFWSETDAQRCLILGARKRDIE